ncbi:MAG: cytochrome c biogenesis protein CcsA, partial [Saprospiraceae bacterium]|nr:cytochrome c biogenesis protein CcsA [Saprospiraceae bacterium]
YHSVSHLSKPDYRSDFLAASYTSVGILYGVLGTITGALWAKYTWGEYWSWDPKQNVAAVALLIYFAYFILRGSFEDPEKAGRLSAVYNIFAFAAMIPLLFVVPRLTSSLHPGNGGNPGFGGEDLDNTMRYFLYPAVIGWILIGVWIAKLRARFLVLRDQVLSGGNI